MIVGLALLAWFLLRTPATPVQEAAPAQQIQPATSTAATIVAPTSTPPKTSAPKPAPKVVAKPQPVVGTAITVSNVLNSINEIRYGQGLSVLTENAQLDAAAQAHLNDMIANNYFAHVSPSGKLPWDFIHESGYVYSYAGENLAGPVQDPTSGAWSDFADIADVTAAWEASPTHWANIIKPEYTETGIAVGMGAHGLIVVQEFATPASN